MKTWKYGLLVMIGLAFASFVYYRVQTLPEKPLLEISFGKAGANDLHLQAAPTGKFNFIRGKVTHGPATNEAEKQ
jgi:hypothetical protein